MFDLRSDDVPTVFGVRFGDAANGEVVGLRAAGEKDQFVRARVN
jgi:hypothetical protein